MKTPEQMNDAEGGQKEKRSFYRKALLIATIVIAAGALSLTMFSRHGHTRDGLPRAEGEIAAMSAALVSYSATNGRVPSDALSTDLLRTATTFDPEQYIPASQNLYKALSGDSDGDPTTRSPHDTEVYFEFKPDMLHPYPPGPGTYVVDPFGNSYGYSTFKAKNPESGEGYNTSFDLWSTNGGKTKKDQGKWVKNW